MPQPSVDLPKDLAAARHRIDQWRDSNVRRRRIPEELWVEAVHLARKHGINRVSETMRLSHNRLTQRLDAHHPRKSHRVSSASRFIEVAPIEMRSGPSKMSIDLVDGTGRSMTLRNIDTRDLSSIVAAFFGGDAR